MHELPKLSGNDAHSIQQLNNVPYSCCYFSQFEHTLLVTTDGVEILAGAREPWLLGSVLGFSWFPLSSII